MIKNNKPAKMISSITKESFFTDNDNCYRLKIKNPIDGSYII